MAFADEFVFARAIAAPVANAIGVISEAGVNVPRFGYFDGLAIGLIVEAGAALGQNDSARLAAGVMAAAGVGAGVKATVLHAWRQEGSAALICDAHYTANAEAMIDGCLARVGWHAQIQVVAGYLHNWGGWVWAFGAQWNLAGVIGTGSALIADGYGRPLIGA